MSFPTHTFGITGGSVVKNLPSTAGDEGLMPGSGRSPWRRPWPPTAVCLPGKSHGQRSLGGCLPQGCKELATTHRVNNNKEEKICKNRHWDSLNQSFLVSVGANTRPTEESLVNPPYNSLQRPSKPYS